MSNQSSSVSFSSYKTSSYKTSSSTGSDPAHHHAQHYTEESRSNDRDGTTIHRTMMETGKPKLEDTTVIPPGGQLEANEGRDRHHIKDLSEEEKRDREYARQAEEYGRRDREYEERMDEEYAKREGGA